VGGGGGGEGSFDIFCKWGALPNLFFSCGFMGGGGGGGPLTITIW